MRRLGMAKKKEGKTSSPTQARSKPKKTEAAGKEKEKRPSPINLWGVAGRQEIMEMRRLWQLRILGR
jgi:hypothetical protein